MCLVAFQKMFRKIFSSIWLCSWKYHRKHIFYLLLTFSHIFSVVKRIYNIIHSSIQKHKQNPEKKSSNLVTFSHIFSVAKQQKHKQTQKQKYSNQIQKHKHFLGLMRGCNHAKHRADCDRREGEIAIDAVLHAIEIDGSRVCNRRFAPSQSTRRQDRDRLGASRNLGKRSRRSKLWTISASSAFLVARSKLWTISLFSWLSSFFLWLSLSFTRGRKRFEGKMNL